MQYISSDFADAHAYRQLAQTLARLDEERGTQGNRLHYLAAPPGTFATIARLLGRHREGRGWTRLIVEKPFGHDLPSARELNELLHRHFDESEIFRIDHYLGKETVQNLLVQRFANGIFEPIWNRQLVDHVQITAAEAIGIEGRAEYYEQTGALRDMFQNHLLQLLALSAMEPPIDFSAEQVRNEKAKVIRALQTPPPTHVVRGQYGRGFRSHGLRVIKAPVRAPKARAHAERWVGTVRRECLDRILIVGRRHLYHVLAAYVAHYNEHRPHRARAQRPPLCTQPPSDARPIATTIDLERVRRRDLLGGLIHEYQLAA
jgi:hypothetical protein